METPAPRPYQAAALEALHAHLAGNDTAPCVVLPTGAGKSLVMAWALQYWKVRYPPFRACVLAHRKELVAQNSAELAGLCPMIDMGIYSAGLGRKDEDASILFAGIDTIFKRWGDLQPFDVLIIDEAHRIPASGEGKYRTFIEGCKKVNPRLRVVGLTATPYRMGCGPICHRDHILNEIVYEANVGDLIAQGFLCRLRSKVGDTAPDLSQVERTHGGDYKEASLAKAAEVVVEKAVRSAVAHIRAEKRKAIIFFCVDVEHCRRVSCELIKYGIEAPAVTGKTPAAERERIAQGFISGRYHAICNVNVYTEGFNAKRVDCIVMLRPTLSMGLYSQMVGRGLRLHPDKTDCLVLDYAHCIDEHGPIDCLEPGRVVLATCAECGDVFSRAVRKCPNCGWVIPKQEIERQEAEEREKRMHEIEASRREILGSLPETVPVDDVIVARHVKPGSPDSIRVTYRSGLSMFNEWICLDHPGYSGEKARKWYATRFGHEAAASVTVDSALQNLFLGQRIHEITATITVVKRGKYSELVRYGFK